MLYIQDYDSDSETEPDSSAAYDTSDYHCCRRHTVGPYGDPSLVSELICYHISKEILLFFTLYNHNTLSLLQQMVKPPHHDYTPHILALTPQPHSLNTSSGYENVVLLIYLLYICVIKWKLKDERTHSVLLLVIFCLWWICWLFVVIPDEVLCMWFSLFCLFTIEDQQ